MSDARTAGGSDVWGGRALGAPHDCQPATPNPLEIKLPHSNPLRDAPSAIQGLDVMTPKHNT